MSVGRVVANRYEIEGRVGSGGMGTVWRARDRVLGRPVALKLLHDGLAADHAFAERFRREARWAARLTHPNAVAVYDSGEDGGTPYIVMEFVSGESLHDRLARGGPLPVGDAVRIARQVLGALGHAHARGLVHRDMKPANVLFDEASGEAKVVDFGIAKGTQESASLTRTGGLIGTAAYLAPEQVSGRPATPASDLYAVGCLLYACLTGSPPFSGETAVSLALKHLQEAPPPLRGRRPEVPPALEAVVMRALEKDPARRFRSAAEMEAALARTGLDTRPAKETTALLHPPDAPVNLEARGAGPTRAEPADLARAKPARPTEVLPRPPLRGPSTRTLAALVAFLVTVATAALVALHLDSRRTPILRVPLPLATHAPAAPASASPPTPSANATPAPAPPTLEPGTSRLPFFCGLPGIHC